MHNGLIVASSNNDGSGLISTFTVARLLSSIEQVPSEAKTLNTFVADKFPVGKTIVPPVPEIAAPTRLSSESSRN